MRVKTIHHVDQKIIDEMYNEYSPVFILSPGRSGSKFIANLLNHSPNIVAFHEPKPTLQYFSDYSFHHQNEDKILTNMINGARMESILEVFIKEKIYVESNQCLTFFAPVLAKLFKRSKFVHLIRHPGDFVRSAIRKGWHKNDSIWESGRVKMEDTNKWVKMDQIEKSSWLWYTTHFYIEKFKKMLNTQRSITIKLENLVANISEVETLVRFIGCENIEKDEITRMQNTKLNELEIHAHEPPGMKKIVEFPLYNDWDSEMKYKLRKYVKELAFIYDYHL